MSTEVLRECIYCRGWKLKITIALALYRWSEFKLKWKLRESNGEFCCQIRATQDSVSQLFPFWLSPACIGTHQPQFVKPLSALWRCQERARSQQASDRVRLPARHTHSAGCIPRKSIRRSSLTSVFAQHYAARVKM